MQAVNFMGNRLTDQIPSRAWLDNLTTHPVARMALETMFDRAVLHNVHVMVPHFWLQSL